MSETEFTSPPSALDESGQTVAERQAGERVHLVRKLSDVLVLPESRLSGNERALIGDILLQALERVEVSLRVEVAARLSKMPDIPAALLYKLVLDEAEVAKVILDASDTVPEACLIDAARTGTTQHREMIARRRDLTPAIADAALAHNEIEICKTILKRADCTLSPKAINSLVALSASIADLRGPLLRRRELEPAHGLLMFWWVNSDRRRRILARFSLDRRVIQEALADLYPQIFMGDEPDPFVKDVLTLADRRLKPRDEEGEVLSREAVRDGLRAARINLDGSQVASVAQMASISTTLAVRLLRDAGGEPFAVLCKALGLPRDEFFSILKDGENSELKYNQNADYLLGVFDMIARDFARAILRYWNWDSNPRIAPITSMLGVSDIGALGGRS